MQDVPVGTRRYRSPRRAQQAAQTRADVVRAAAALFGEVGWARTTVAAVAQGSGVSAETVYKLFGSKAHLLKATMDFTLVGDDQAIPLAERPAFKRIAIGSLRERAHAVSLLAADVYARSAGVWRAMVEAAPGDSAIEAVRAQFERERRRDVDRIVELVLGERGDDATATAVWLLGGPDAYIKLTTDGGLDRDAYVSTLTDALVRVLSQRPPRSPVRVTKRSRSPRTQKRPSEPR